MIGFVYQHWDLSIFFIDWEQPRTIPDQPKYDSPRTSLQKLYSNRFPKGEGKSSRITSDIIASKRKRRSHKMNRNTSPSEMSKSSSIEKYTPDFSSICSIVKSPLQETTERSYIHDFPISVWRTYFIANEWYKLQTRRRINVALQSIYTLCFLQVSWHKRNLISSTTQQNLNNYIVSDIRFGIVDVSDTRIDRCKYILRNGEQFYAGIRDLYIHVHIYISFTMVRPIYVLREIH